MSGVADINALPDELLLEIFSQLADGATLIESVPLVCRRWHSLARETRAWERVEVRVRIRPDRPDGSDVDGTTARILRRAPFINHLDIHPVNGYSFAPAHSWVAVLDRCQGPILGMSLYSSYRKFPPYVKKALDMLVERNQSNLRRFALHVPGYHQKGLTFKLLRLLKRLHELEWLRLTFDVGSHMTSCVGVTDKMHKLQKLEILEPSTLQVPFTETDWLLNLILSAPPKLRVLALPDLHDVDPALMKVVNDFGQLMSLRCNVEVLPHLVAPLLQRLEVLTVLVKCKSPRNDESASAMEAMEALVPMLPTELPRLRSLTIHDVFHHRPDEEFPGAIASPLVNAKCLLNDALLKAAPNLTSLSMNTADQSLIKRAVKIPLKLRDIFIPPECAWNLQPWLKTVGSLRTANGYHFKEYFA